MPVCQDAAARVSASAVVSLKERRDDWIREQGAKAHERERERDSMPAPVPVWRACVCVDVTPDEREESHTL